MWRVHEGRSRLGLGSTADDYHKQNNPTDRNIRYNIPLTWTLYELFTGATQKVSTVSPFARGSELLEEYPLHLHDMHDDVLFEYGQAQRHEVFQMDSSKSAGDTTLIPMDDNDEILHFYDIQGESLYTNPPDPNLPVIDHGLEEDRVWAFPKNLYNMDVISNPYADGDDFKNSMLSHVPFWKDKLMTPAFYRKDKWDKMLMQWEWRT